MPAAAGVAAAARRQTPGAYINYTASSASRRKGPAPSPSGPTVNRRAAPEPSGVRLPRDEGVRGLRRLPLHGVARGGARHQYRPARTTTTVHARPSRSAEEAARGVGASEHPAWDASAWPSARRPSSASSGLATLLAETMIQVMESCAAPDDVEKSSPSPFTHELCEEEQRHQVVGGRNYSYSMYEPVVFGGRGSPPIWGFRAYWRWRPSSAASCVTTIQVEATLRMTASCAASEDVELSGSEFSDVLDLTDGRGGAETPRLARKTFPPLRRKTAGTLKGLEAHSAAPGTWQNSGRVFRGGWNTLRSHRHDGQERRPLCERVRRGRRRRRPTAGPRR